MRYRREKLAFTLSFPVGIFFLWHVGVLSPEATYFGYLSVVSMLLGDIAIQLTAMEGKLKP